jgi:regulator of sigma E protease
MLFVETLLAFIIVIGILVTVHEFGHYWVARQLGVKILRFSVGFGQALWKKNFGKDNSEFVIAAIPLGGYVKMLDEREGEVPQDELHRAFNRQSLKVRTAIVFAGPLFNFLFAIIVYTLMYMVGITGIKALVGEVTPDSLADQAGFQTGYQIIAVNNQPTVRWDSVIQATLQELLDDNEHIVYSVQNKQGTEYDLSLNLQGFTIDDIAEGQFFEKIGFKPFRPIVPPIIGDIVPNSAAERAGLQSGDKIIKLNDQTINDWNTWAEYITEHPEQEISAVIERNHEHFYLTLRPDNVEGKGRMGVYSPRNYTIPDEYKGTERYNLAQAFIQAIEKTWDISILTLRVMVKMLTWQVSYEHISGPISIAQFAGQSAQLGFDIFLSFLGLVSVSLGVINLLPIPLLDGGHLLMYFIEWIKGSPVTETTENLLQRIGLVLLLGLMTLAIFNDLERLLR